MRFCLPTLLLGTLAVSCLTSSVFAQADQPEITAPPRRAVAACPTLEELGYLLKQITEISLDITSRAERLPDDCSVGLFAGATGWEMTSPSQREFTWAASELYSQPAYFDDPILERYGQTHRPLIQPFLSGAHFFGTFPLMPYKIGLDRTHDHIYTLGYYRPGSPTPCIGRRHRLEADAAGFEAATLLALIFLLP
jgi:hypothetical protein